jgi:hypothetical protein
VALSMVVVREHLGGESGAKGNIISLPLGHINTCGDIPSANISICYPDVVEWRIYHHLWSTKSVLHSRCG